VSEIEDQINAAYHMAASIAGVRVKTMAIQTFVGPERLSVQDNTALLLL